MHYVYILKSDEHDETYVGSSADVKRRLDDHNSGKSKHTAKYKPWKVVWYSSFITKQKAEDFEK